jgi:polyribonucleotide nucleotidyltransferase
VVGIPTAIVVQREIGGRILSIETGRMARQADGAVVVRYGDTMVLATAQSQKAAEGLDFFPLTVEYREKTAAAGMIPGGFFKREGRPTTKEILGCRIIDRSIRPMFPDGYKAEVQVLSQVLSTDRENDPDVVAAIACFAALAISSIPHGRTLGMCRIGLRDDKLIVNPTWSVVQSPENQLNLTVTAHEDAVVMVEAGAKEVPEAKMLEALELGHKVSAQVVELIEQLRAKAGRVKKEFKPPQRDAVLVKAIEDQFGRQLRAAPLAPGPKQVRSAASKAAKEAVVAAFQPPAGANETQLKVFKANLSEIISEIVKDGERQSILKGKRADGRDHAAIRQITIEVGVLPRVHGSVLFTRGETQALGIVTLGGVDDQQIIDGIMPEGKKRFLLHYSFPPFSVGEVKRTGSPGRREIGHGALAERGVEIVLPTREVFPYTIRITSEILESNGSSSMATVCASTLALMDAGVPIKQPVAGIAMGLVMEGKDYAILSDILGSEDACGDMDFKVVGTGTGITALQMDIKCDGLTRQILSQALEQARVGRIHILKKMLEVLKTPRAQLSPNAPRLESVKVPQEKIGLIIGPAGKNIRAMQENFECKISIEDGGLCTITGVNSDKVMACVEHIKSMTAEVEVGQIYEGRVTAIKEFGAFIEILPSQEGLCHVSELSDAFIRTVTDVVRIGDKLKVKVIGIDDFGKVKLSRKAVILSERGDKPAEGGGHAGAGPAPAGSGAGAAATSTGSPGGGASSRGPTPEAARPPFGDRDDRGPRRDDRGGFRGDRPQGDRPQGDRAPEASGRPERGDGPRGSFADRGPVTNRGPVDDRGPREDRGPVTNRGPVDDRGPREDRGPVTNRGPVDDRGPREDRGPVANRGPVDDRGPREDRGPVANRGPVDDRGPREDRGPVANRGPVADRGPREDRGPVANRGPVDADRPPAARPPAPRPPAGRGRGGTPPMAEFDTTDEDLIPSPKPVASGPVVGDLEDADSLFNGDGPGGSGGGSGGGDPRRRRRSPPRRS